jgi:hypothetical protein
MTTLMNVYVNTVRNACRIGDDARRRSEARRTIKLFLASNATTPVSDSMVPDYLINDNMVDRFFGIEPPQFRSTTEFDMIIEEIERAYVLGLFFSALSSSVVVIERLLNTARMELHKLVPNKKKRLWGKGPTNDWQPNIDALLEWQYLSTDLAQELSELYDVRCRYLHSGNASGVVVDSLRAVIAAYRLLGEIIGFPPRLFQYGNFGIECLDYNDPLVRVFYSPIIVNGS